MEIRRQISILKVTKDLLYYERFTKGICAVLQYQFETSRITANEYKIIRNLLEEHKPTPDNDYKSFTENEFWGKDEFPLKDSCWWQSIETNSETRQIRIKYVSQILNNLVSQL